MTFAERLDAAKKAFHDTVTGIENNIRGDLVIPFCNKHGMSFKSGMGSFSFEHPEIGSLEIEPDGASNFYNNGIVNIDAKTIDTITSDGELSEYSEEELSKIKLGISILTDNEFLNIATILHLDNPSSHDVIGASIDSYSKEDK